MSDTSTDKLIPEWELDDDRQVVVIGVLMFLALLIGGWLIGRGTDALSDASVDLPVVSGSSSDDLDESGELQARVDDLGLTASALVDGDVVTVTGDVPTNDVRESTIDAVAGIDGVETVVDELRVVLPEVESAVADTDVSGIDVAMEDFTAVVAGTVASEAERASVVDAAADVAGVTMVDDRLTVVVPEPVEAEPVEETPEPEPEPVVPTTADLQAAVDGVMAGSMPALTGVVDGTTVTVTGVVVDAADRQARLLDAAAIEGVTDVIDQTTLLTDDVAAALAAAGIAGAEAATTGTDVTLTGTVANREAADTVVAAVTAVNEVTAVDDQLVLQTDLIAAELAGLQELEPITFASGSAELSPTAITTIDQAAEILLANPTAIVEVAGHTDDQGPDDANLALSQARAETVLVALAERGVDTTALTAVGYGETQPIVDDATPEARAQNRRIEFRVS